MLSVTHLVGFMAGGSVAPISANYEDNADSTSALTTYTFVGVGIGTAAPDRHVVVCIGSNSNGRTVSSVTVAGQACTVINSVVNSTRTVAMAVTNAPVTSGTTATVTVTFNAGEDGCGIATYSLNTSGSVTPTDTATSTTTSGSVSLDIPAGGVGIIAIRDSGSGGTISGLTKDDESGVDGTVGTILYGHDEFSSAQTGLSVSWSTTGGTAAIAASFGP